MKKLFFAALLFTAATACNNDNASDTTNNDVEDSSVKTTPTVENVNGNIPDSSNTIDVGTDDGKVNQ